jgi:hypothetical protein
MKQKELQLLTAFVDGELTRRQRKFVLQMLNRSSEARKVLQQLQENAHRVKQLPRHSLPAHFAASVLQKISAPGQGAPRKVGKFQPRLAWAAAILLGLGGAYFFGFGGGNQPSPTALPSLAGDTSFQKSEKGMAFSLADLGNEPQQLLLTRELKREPAYHLDVVVSNTSETLERIQTACKDIKIRLLVDATVQASLPKKTSTDFLLYMENIRPEEVTEMLHRLGMEEKNHQAPSVLVQTLNAEDRRLLAGNLGIETNPQPTTKEEKLFQGPFIEAPREKVSSPSENPLPPERFAILVPCSTEENLQPSPQVQTFLHRRQHSQPGTLQVMLIIHQSSDPLPK